ncbi:MAG: hypothetical protein KAI47_13965 [Deltaproteobacteria bacterium]|nr:hypothetical protein [Deltaproteobacteria bacterium]
MSHENPYAPPAATTTPPPGSARRRPAPDAGTLDLSTQGMETVSGLAKWMRIAATFFTIFGVLMILASGLILMRSDFVTSVFHGSSPAATGIIGGVLFYSVFMLLGALWLRRAARHFTLGVEGDATSPLAEGFKQLRRYLVLYGLFQLIGLGISLVKVAFR